MEESITIDTTTQCGLGRVHTQLGEGACSTFTDLVRRTPGSSEVLFSNSMPNTLDDKEVTLMGYMYTNSGTCACFVIQFNHYSLIIDRYNNYFYWRKHKIIIFN